MNLPNLNRSLENIYICPSEICNLNCHYCYTRKTPNCLSSDQILSFINRYQSHLSSISCRLKSILFCGGEVFLLPWFIPLVNTLLSRGIFISVITNGTIDQLSAIKDPQNCQLLVSFDGPKKIHDQNRGQGNFARSVKFVRHALSLGFPVEIFYLITKDSYLYKDTFDLLGLPKTYLTDRLHSLTPAQVLDIKKNYPTYPAKDFGCFQLALQSDGRIYGCCESPNPLASIKDDPQIIINNFCNSLKECNSCDVFFSAQSCRQRPTREHCKKTSQLQCFGCCNPHFLCGFQKELSLPSCQQVVKSFHD